MSMIAASARVSAPGCVAGPRRCLPSAGGRSVSSAAVRPAAPALRGVRGRFTQNNGRHVLSVRVRAAAEDTPEPEDARGAIAIGLKMYADSKYEDAYGMFTKVVKDQLPGTGVKRFRDKPPGVSDGEKMAALYNIACCCAQMGDAETGLTALAGAMEKGFEDWETLASDPDLEPLRTDDRFEGLVGRFRPNSSSGGPMGWLAYQLDFKNSAISRAMKK